MDEKQKHNVMELPPLPAPEIDWLEYPGFDADQMREYGTQCALLASQPSDGEARKWFDHALMLQARLDELENLASQAGGQAVPDGWQLVPKKLDGRCPLLMNSISFGAFTREAAQRRWDAILAAAPKPPAAQAAPNNDEVICPNCVHQFRAVPVNVQHLMLAAGFEPPFTKPPAGQE